MPTDTFRSAISVGVLTTLEETDILSSSHFRPVGLAHSIRKVLPRLSRRSTRSLTTHYEQS